MNGACPSFEDALSQCLSIYKQAPETILSSYMQLLCEFYAASSSYIYRFNSETREMVNIAQWSTDSEYFVTEDLGDKMNTSVLFNWIRSTPHGGIIHLDKEMTKKDPSSLQAQVIETFHLENVVFCTVEDAKRNTVGIIGMSNRAETSCEFDPRLITIISRFVAQDVTREIFDAALQQLHLTDGLTGLYNRAGYSKRIDEILKQSPARIGILSININGLKHINENLGILMGDEHIKRSSDRLSAHFDYEFFRMSGDEFFGIAIDVKQEDFDEKVLDLMRTMRAEHCHDFSMGFAWGNPNDLSRLQLEADTLMYINKQEYYSTSKRSYDNVADNTLSDLLSFLADDEFMIYLQPQVRLEDGSLYGAEALIRRFDKKNQKMVFPDQFIPLYEKKSIIRHVDMFVVEAVCKQLAVWGAEGKAIPISVNLSRVTLQEYGIVETIAQICDTYKVPHELVIIEVTERVGLVENNVASALITDFKDNGFNISLDDFGCAYSNIVTLAQIEVDEVKIDKSLVDFILTNEKNRILVKNMLGMCNELEGASTLAEGIECEEQAKLLHELGCHLGQGYFYSRPMAVNDFSDKYINVMM